jgi:uncharacterized iron-regulated protein
MSPVVKIALSLVLIVVATGCPSKRVAYPSQPKTQAVLLGSYHDFSDRRDQYAIYKSILERVQAEVVMIELPVNWFDSRQRLRRDYVVPTQRGGEISLGELFDGAKLEWTDGQAVDDYIKAKGPKVIPIDIENRNKIYHGPWQYHHNNKKLDAWLDEEFGRLRPDLHQRRKTLKQTLDECDNLSLEELNSSGCDEEILNALSADVEAPMRIFHRERIEWWKKRNRVMADHICEGALGQHRAKVLIVVGHFHRYILKELLEDCEHLQVNEFYQGR